MTNNYEINKDFKDAILREQVRLAIRQLPTMQMTSLMVALVLSFTVRHIVPRRNIVTWILMVVSIVVSRIFLYYKFRTMHKETFDGAYWKKAYLLLALFSGIVWGLSAFIIFPIGKPEIISLFVLVIASLSAATTVSHSSIRLGPTAWAGPAMLFYAVHCAMDGGDLEYTIALLIVIYLITIIRYSFDHNDTITSSISLKFENLELLKEVRETNDVLRHASAIDGLTGLANRRNFDECMDREWRRAKRDKKSIALIMLDIDHFKAYNDNYGHQEGDDCLKKVAAVVAESLKRPADLAARYGGEEFVVVLPDTDVQGATDIAERLRSEIEVMGVPHAQSPTAGVVTISVGVASLVPEQGMAYTRLLKLVDTALYAAKHDGRNRVKTA